MPLNTPLIVYTVHERERDGRKFWTRVGDATVARDGQIDIELRALPVNGKLALRGIKAAEIQGTPPADATERVLALAARVVDADQAAVDAYNAARDNECDVATERRDELLQELGAAVHALKIARGA